MARFDNLIQVFLGKCSRPIRSATSVSPGTVKMVETGIETGNLFLRIDISKLQQLADKALANKGGETVFANGAITVFVDGPSIERSSFQQDR